MPGMPPLCWCCCPAGEEEERRPSSHAILPAWLWLRRGQTRRVSAVWCWLFERGPNKQRLARLRVPAAGALRALLLERSSLLNQSIDPFDQLINSIDLGEGAEGVCKFGKRGAFLASLGSSSSDWSKRARAFFVFDPFLLDSCCGCMEGVGACLIGWGAGRGGFLYIKWCLEKVLFGPTHTIR